MTSLAYYEEIFKKNKVKLIEAKQFILNDLEEFSQKSEDCFERKDLIYLRKAIHKMIVTLKNINAVKLLVLLEELKEKKSFDNMVERYSYTVSEELRALKESVMALEV